MMKYYWETKECKHNPITLSRGYGVITGGKTIGESISLFIGLDISRYNPQDNVIDSYGVIRDSIRQIYLPIEDMGIPHRNKIGMMDKVLSIMHGYLKDGQNVHVNCFGGHGRTGLFLACYLGKYHKDLINNNPVKFLRENYCKDAVETYVQHSFVAEYTGTEKPVSKDYWITPEQYYGYGKYGKSDWEVKNAMDKYNAKVDKYHEKQHKKEWQQYITTTSSKGKCRICENDADDRIFLSNVGLICQFCWHDISKMNTGNKDKDVNIETDRYAG